MSRPIANILLAMIKKITNKYIIDMDEEQKDRIIEGLVDIASDIVSESISKTIEDQS